MADVKGMHKARNDKQDEFYTLYEDIEKEMIHYRSCFKGKTVLMNCDDPIESNFWKYFHKNFTELGLKKIIATHYESKSISSYKTEYYGGNDNDYEDCIKTDLIGNGDFRSPECIEILKNAEIVVTNPPFSLFREYILQLLEYGKQFIILGNNNAISYKQVFPYIRDNKLWYGVSIHSHGRYFRVPDDYPLSGWECKTDENGTKYINVKGIRWYTNIDYPSRHTDLETGYYYYLKDFLSVLQPDIYQKYDDYDIINVNKTKEIPMDYYDKMGVPISFFDRYNPEQFEILELYKKAFIKGKQLYVRFIIRRKNREGIENE